MAVIAFLSVGTPRETRATESAEAGLAAPVAGGTEAPIDARADSSPSPSPLALPLPLPLPSPSSSPSQPAPSPSVLRRGMALGAAVVPGLVLHGAGHVTLGDRSTGLRLLAWEGIGLASIAVGVGGLALTGASSRTVGVFIPLLIGGAGLFGATWLSDVYGVASTPRVPGEPARPPLVQLEAGLRYVDDPYFSYRALLVAAADLRPGAFRITPSAWLATGGGNQRLRLEGAWRIVGPTGTMPASTMDPAAPLDGSYLDFEAAITHHRYGADGFAITLGEISVGARLDLRRAARALAGSFVEGALGVAAGGITYFDRTTDATDLLLGRLGWGVYWGNGGGPRGEVALNYDHRHDGYAGGMKLSGLGSGTMGSFGVRALAYLSTHLGLAADARVGSAYILGASLLVRPGGPP